MRVLKGGTEEGWLELRRQGMTGSDLAAIMRLHPYKGPTGVYFDKIGLMPPVPMNDAMIAGHDLEDYVAQRYTRATGQRVEAMEPWSLITHDLNSWMRGSLDRMVASGTVGLECKTSRYGIGFGEPGTDQVPDHYFIQVMWYMEVTGIRQWDVAVLIGGQDFRIYHVFWNERTAHALQVAGRNFWMHHVMGRIEPAPDGTESQNEVNRMKFPLATKGMLDLTQGYDGAEHVQLAESLASLKSISLAMKKMKKTKIESEAIIKGFIGEHEGLLLPNKEKIGWKNSRPTLKIDHQEVNADFARELLKRGMSITEINRIKTRHLIQGQSKRSFRPSFLGEESNDD
jgi:putative phage-type endonuclease